MAVIVAIRALVRAGFLMILAVYVSAGCTAPRGPFVITDPDAGNRIPAIKKAADTGDRTHLADLVKALDSDDPAVRFYAIGALQRLTGKTFDYRYFDDETDRQPALKRWQQWLDTTDAEKAGK